MTGDKDIEEVIDIIKNSGNSFHCKVLQYMQENGWTVQISPYYTDNATNKPREIDLIAEKAFPVTKNYETYSVGNGTNSDGTINVKLFIECKYVKQKTVFWFHDKDYEKAEDLVLKTTGLSRGNRFNQDHHYLQNCTFVAKLFADGGKKQAENEIFYKALNQSLNAMVYYRRKKSIINSGIPALKTIEYPVIVCNGFDKLFQVDNGSSVDPSNIKQNFLLEVNYAYKSLSSINKNEYFLIDIVNYDLLDRYLGKIQNDVAIAVKSL